MLARRANEHDAAAAAAAAAPRATDSGRQRRARRAAAQHDSEDDDEAPTAAVAASPSARSPVAQAAVASAAAQPARVGSRAAAAAVASASASSDPDSESELSVSSRARGAWKAKLAGRTDEADDDDDHRTRQQRARAAASARDRLRAKEPQQPIRTAMDDDDDEQQQDEEDTLPSTSISRRSAAAAGAGGSRAHRSRHSELPPAVAQLSAPPASLRSRAVSANATINGTGSSSHSSSFASPTSPSTTSAIAAAAAAQGFAPPSPAATPVEYTALPYHARVEYEKEYSRKWKAPLAFLVDTLLGQYAHLHRSAASASATQPSPSDSQSHTPSSSQNGRYSDLEASAAGLASAGSFHGGLGSVMYSADFEAELLGSPPAGGQGTLRGGINGVASPVASSSMLTFSSYSASHTRGGGTAPSEHDRSEAERHALAKGKLKVQGLLLRKKQLEWERRVAAGEATWQELEQAEQETEERRAAAHAAQSQQSKPAPRILDPRDRESHRLAAAAAAAAADARRKEAEVEWYWNGIPIAAVAIMRVLVHNHAFDASMPPLPLHLAAAAAAAAAAAEQSRGSKRPAAAAVASAAKASAAATAAAAAVGSGPDLCRTWILSDFLYSLRTLLLAALQPEPEVPASGSAAAIGIPVPRAAAGGKSKPASSASSRAPAAEPASPEALAASASAARYQMCAKLVWLLNNVVVLLHLTKRLGLQRREEVQRMRAADSTAAAAGDKHAAPAAGHAHGRRHSLTMASLPSFSANAAVWDCEMQVPFPPVVAAASSDDGLDGLSARLSAATLSPPRLPAPGEGGPLDALSSAVDDYLFELDPAAAVADGPRNSYEWFFARLRHLGQIMLQALVALMHANTEVARIAPSALLRADELLQLDCGPLDSYLDSLGSLYSDLTGMELLNLLKTGIMRGILTHLTAGVISRVIDGPSAAERAEAQRAREAEEQQRREQQRREAEAAAQSKKNKKQSKAEKAAAAAAAAAAAEAAELTPEPEATEPPSLLSRPTELGMKLTMLHSAIEDWSQRLTSFAHPFVYATRLAVAPMREVALFLLLGSKAESFSDEQAATAIDDLQLMAPTLQKAQLLALLVAYNAEEANEGDRVPSKIVRALKRAVDKEAAAEAAANGAAAAGSSSSCAAVPIVPFTVSADLGAQLGKFILSAVDLPASLTSHPAFQFLRKGAAEGLVL